MEKCFNTTGVCIPELNYMVNIEEKLNKITSMINKGQYFVINRPRQYGKTTTIHMLKENLIKDFIVISCSFEGLDEYSFNDSTQFSKTVLELFSKAIRISNRELSIKLLNKVDKVNGLVDLSDAITDFIEESDKRVVLLIDEVDKSSNNQLFLSFLGMLRNKYLLARQKEDYTFHSVVLVGVHDIKNLKLKIRPEEEVKLNSPWNIAVNFKVDMSFNLKEIESMLLEYSDLNNIAMDTKKLSEKLYYYTSGYPFLVSRLCQIIDEDILDLNKRSWKSEDIELSVKEILKEQNTLFDDLIKNVENNNRVYKLIERILVKGDIIPFTVSEPTIGQCYMYGIIRDDDGKCKIDNRVFELYLYNYLAAKTIMSNEEITRYNFRSNFIKDDNTLDFEKILLRFQQFMKEQYSTIDNSFIEREGRLLFLAFIKPIINGTGFDFKEVKISEERRLDVVVTYNNEKYIAELKIWYGNEYHQKGLKQLSEYLEINGLKKGYLVIFNFNKNRDYKQEKITYENKEIFVAYV